MKILKRVDILPLMIETGRYLNWGEEMRICRMCCLDDMENEFHLIFYCPFFLELRKLLLNNIKTDIDVVYMDDTQRLNWLFTFETFRLARYLEKA